MRGYFAIGVYRAKTETNVGTLWRSAYQLGASFVFTVGARYRKQRTDTYATSNHVPLFHFDGLDDLICHMPDSCRLVGVETGGEDARLVKHPNPCCYLLGAEDFGLPTVVLSRCDMVVSIPAVRRSSFNVSVAGSIVMYERFRQTQSKGVVSL